MHIIVSSNCNNYVITNGMKKVKLPLLCRTVAPGKSRQMASCSENRVVRYQNTVFTFIKIYFHQHD